MKNQKRSLITVRILLIILTISIMFAVYTWSVLLYMQREKMEFKEASWDDRCLLYNKMISIEQDLGYLEFTKGEIKEHILKVKNPSLHFEITVNLSGNTKGLTSTCLRIILIDPDLDSVYYGYVLMHEYVHLDNFISDERLTDFLTIKYLWESDDIFLKYIVCRIVEQKIMFDDFQNKDYDCTAQLIEYFKGENVL